jgi:hypothetical protein
MEDAIPSRRTGALEAVIEVVQVMVITLIASTSAVVPRIALVKV